jgi:hypothetical protein
METEKKTGWKSILESIFSVPDFKNHSNKAIKTLIIKLCFKYIDKHKVKSMRTKVWILTKYHCCINYWQIKCK